MSKRLLDGATRVNRDTIRRALLNQMEQHSDNQEGFLDEMAHLIHDYHDFQAMVKQTSKGEFIRIIFQV